MSPCRPSYLNIESGLASTPVKPVSCETPKSGLDKDFSVLQSDSQHCCCCCDGRTCMTKEQSIGSPLLHCDACHGLAQGGPAQILANWFHPLPPPSHPLRKPLRRPPQKGSKTEARIFLSPSLEWPITIQNRQCKKSVTNP